MSAAKWLGACLLALALVSGQLLDQWDAWRATGVLLAGAHP